MPAGYAKRIVDLLNAEVTKIWPSPGHGSASAAGSARARAAARLESRAKLDGAQERRQMGPLDWRWRRDSKGALTGVRAPGELILSRIGEDSRDGHPHSL